MASGFPLLVNGVRVRTSEALYQACRFPHLPEVQRLIIEHGSPMTAKMKSKRHRHDSRRDWNRVRVNVMRWCLRVKLAQNWDRFSKLLLDTRNRPIVEQSRRDDFWGAKPLDERTLMGMNVLGRLLMELRSSVQTEARQKLLRVEPISIPDFLLWGRPVEPVTARTLEQAKTVGRRVVGSQRGQTPQPRGNQLPLRWAQEASTVQSDQGSAEDSPDQWFNLIKRYPNYKESGVIWLGDVPAHWGVRRLKYAAALNPSRTESRNSLLPDTTVTFLPMERVWSDGQIDPEEISPASKVWTGFTYFRRDDVLVAKITPCFENGKGAHLHSLPTAIGFGSTEFHVLRAKPFVLPQFLYRLTTASEFRKLGTDAMIGAAGQQRVPSSFLANYSVPLPPLPEQAAIVRFLDHVDGGIRRYIRAKQKLIALLEEQKQAIVHQVVTGQIDVRTGLSYPAYKPSGLDWLGDVPAHWEVRRNGRLFVQRNETGFPELPILEVSINTGVRIRDFGNSDRKQMMAVRSEYKRAVKGDIAYNMMRMWQGAVGVTPVDGLVSPAYVVARPLKGTESRYFCALFRTNVYMGEVDKYSHGIVKDRNRLYWEDFKQMPTPFPPPDEQGCIVRYLNKTTHDIDTAIDRSHREIALLREYRTRLIADVVTGKIDVREDVHRES